MSHPIANAFKVSLPILFCYAPLGIVYGVLFTEQGFAWYYAPVFSFFVFAGAMQFVALSILGTGGSIALLISTLIPLGIRNIFYGFSMLERYRSAPPPLRFYLAHGLVDATFSLLTAHKPYEGKKDMKFMTSLTIIVHSYWVLGTFAGAALTSIFNFPEGLEFSLTYFFAAMAVDQVLKNKDWTPICISCAALILALCFMPKYLFLTSLALTILTCLILPEKKRGLA